MAFKCAATICNAQSYLLCVPNSNVYIYSAVQCTKVAIQLIGQPIERGQFQFQFRKTKAENFYLVDDPAISTSYSTPIRERLSLGRPEYFYLPCGDQK